MNRDMLFSCFSMLPEIPVEHRLTQMYQRTYALDPRRRVPERTRAKMFLLAKKTEAEDQHRAPRAR
jgi:hypothetical protein